MAWKKKTLYDRIVDRWKELDSDYGKINTNRDIITNYFRSDELIEVDEKGNLLGRDIYNAAGPWYSRLMATGFQGSLVSKNISWIRYQMAQYELQGIDPLDIWVQDIKDFMTDVYQRSNFYDLQPQFTLDGLTTGSPVMFAEENILAQKTMWIPVHYKKVRIYYDKFNQEEGVIVKDPEWTAKQIFDTFIVVDDDQGTKRKAKLPVAVNNALEQGRLNDKFTVYRAVFKVDDPIFDGWEKPVGDWSWYSVYFLELTSAEQVNNKKNKPLNENMGFFTQPFVVWNFDKKPWEVSSRTPAFYAVWDCLGLQQVYKNYMENIQLKNRPPRMILHDMKDRLSLGPEGEIFVDSEEYDRPPKALDMIGDVQLNKELGELYDEALKRWFYIDRFQMFSDLARMKKQPVSASQIWQMAGEKSTLLSPAIETHSRYLESSDAKMVSIEWAAGRGPFNRQTLAEVTDIVIANAKGPVRSIGVMPVFIGALAQAQKRTQVLEPINAGLEAGKMVMEIFPDLTMAVREYETLSDIFEATDFPQKNLKPKEEWLESVSQRNEALAQQQQLENSIEIAKASKDVSGPVDQNSILGQLQETIS
jgi:hypothetical protein